MTEHRAAMDRAWSTRSSTKSRSASERDPSTGHLVGDAILDLVLGIEGTSATVSPLSAFIAQAVGAAAGARTSQAGALIA
jgi:hypothetical protein